jgi:Tfp pilus assembly protein FimT
MKMTSAIGTTSDRNRCRARAFTLIELVLVMALLIVIVSLISPTMSKFFGARSVDSEVKKFVALTHYGQSRAVSEGVPTMLWIDARQGTYGLEQMPGYGDTDPKAVENKLADGVRIGVSQSTVKPLLANSQTGRIASGQVAQTRARLPAIYFLPDGTIAGTTSVSGVSLQNSNNPPVWIVPSGNGLTYEIQNQNSANQRR